MNPAILMMLLSNNYRGGVSSIDEPDHYFDDDLSSAGIDPFLWTIVAVLVLGLAIAVFLTVKR
jgi:hypothetical protein